MRRVQTMIAQEHVPRDRRPVELAVLQAMTIWRVGRLRRSAASTRWCSAANSYPDPELLHATFHSETAASTREHTT